MADRAKKAFEKTGVQSSISVADLIRKMDSLTDRPQDIASLPEIYNDKELLSLALDKNLDCFKHLPEDKRKADENVEILFGKIKARVLQQKYSENQHEFFTQVPPDATKFEEFAKQLIDLYPLPYLHRGLDGSKSQKIKKLDQRLAVYACLQDPELLSRVDAKRQNYEHICRAVVEKHPDAIQYVHSSADVYKELLASSLQAQIAQNPTYTFPENELPMDFIRAGYDTFKTALDTNPALVVCTNEFATSCQDDEISFDDIQQIQDMIIRYAAETKKLPKIHGGVYDLWFMADDYLIEGLLKESSKMADDDAAKLIASIAEHSGKFTDVVFSYGSGYDNFENEGTMNTGVFKDGCLGAQPEIQAALKSIAVKNLTVRRALMINPTPTSAPDNSLVGNDGPA